MTAWSRTSSRRSAAVKWLFVIARNSSFIYKGKSVDVRQVGRDLGVRYVLEGSIRKSANRIRLTAQLIDASSGDHLWADRYDGGLDEVFELQDQVVEKLIGAIEPKLRVTEIARSRRKRSESLDAFDLVLQALPKFTSMTREGFAGAIELLDRAIKLEPTYAQALGYAAWCRATRSFQGVSPDPAGDFREASLLAQRALDADPEDPIALRAAAATIVIVRKDYQGALDLVERSLDIDANSAVSWGIRGWINTWAGEWKEALEDFEKGLRLSPFDPWGPNYWVGMANCLIQADRFEEALRWARKALQQSPRWGAPYRSVITCLVLLDRLDEARAVAKEYLKLEPHFTVRHWAETTPFRQTPTHNADSCCAEVRRPSRMTEQRRLAAILVADVVGYSKLVGSDEAGTLAKLQALRSNVIEPAIAKHAGRLFKAVGDGFLVEFASAVQAVEAARAIQQANAEGELPLRIGIHVGDVVVQGDDLMGDGVNVAARVEGIADAGGIAISREVHDQVRDKLDVGFEDKGEIELKNIARPVHVFSIAGSKPTAATAPRLPLPDKPSIAVLPFQNMSGDPEQEYFADGMVEDIITALSRFKSLFVIARNSASPTRASPSTSSRSAASWACATCWKAACARRRTARITGQLIDASKRGPILGRPVRWRLLPSLRSPGPGDDEGSRRE